jgi:hypothetical protein
MRMNVEGVGFYSGAQGVRKPAFARPVGSWTTPRAPLQSPTRSLAGERYLAGGDGTTVAKETPAGHDGASRPGAALPRALLSPERSLLIMSSLLHKHSSENVARWDVGAKRGQPSMMGLNGLHMHGHYCLLF